MDPFLNLNLNPNPSPILAPIAASAASAAPANSSSTSNHSSSAPSPLATTSSSGSPPAPSAPGLDNGGSALHTLAVIDSIPPHTSPQAGRSRPDQAAATLADAHQQQGVSKRPRTVQACLPCRQRKERCTGEFPCIRCTKRNIACVYAQPMAHHLHLHHPYQQVAQQQHSSARHQQHQPNPSSPAHFTLQQIAQLHLADPSSTTSNLNNNNYNNTSSSDLLGSPTFVPTSPTSLASVENNVGTSDELNSQQRSVLNQQFQFQLQLQRDQQQRLNEQFLQRYLQQQHQLQHQYHQYMQHCLSSATQPTPTVTVSVNNLGELVGLSSLGFSSAVHVHRDWSRPLSDGHLILHPFSDPTLMLQSNSSSFTPSAAAASASVDAPPLSPSSTVPLSSIMFARERESFLPSHHIAPIFIDAFFNSVAPWIPAASNVNASNVLVIPHDLLHQVYARPDVSNLGLLYAVMCLGAHSLERTRHITIQNEPRPLSRLYFERARHILSPALTGQTHSIVTVQAFMLLAFYALNLPGTAASTLCQLALQMVADAGLNHAQFPFKNLAEIANHTPYDKDHGDQLLATLYSLHVSLALARGQPIYFPTPAPFLALCQRDLHASSDSYAIWSLRLSNLTSAAIRAHFHFSEDLRTQLAAFRDQLPAHMRFQRTSSATPANPTLFAQSALLNLRYYTLVLLLAQTSGSGAKHNTDTITRTIAAISHILQAIRDHLSQFPFPLVHECTVMLAACARVSNHAGSDPSSSSSASASSSSASGSPAPPAAAVIVGDDADSDRINPSGVDVSVHLDAIIDLVYASMAQWPEMATLAFTVHGLEKVQAAARGGSASLIGSGSSGSGGSGGSGGDEQAHQDQDDMIDEDERDDNEDEILRDPWRVISAFNESSERVMEAIEMWGAVQQREVVAKVLEKYLPQP